MFDALHTKLESAFRHIRGKSLIGQKEVDSTLRDIRMALLEADVNFKVAKDFCARISEKALGQAVLKSLTPDQQIIKLVHDELTTTMGSTAQGLDLHAAPPVVILMVGLQGSGKTTTSAKLAAYLRKELKRRPLLLPADTYRPAAIEQLKILGKQLNIDVYDSDPSKSPVNLASEAREFADKRGFDTLIIDSAGRLQIDEKLMDELKAIREKTNPREILLVADAMTGQEAVNVAKGFNEALGVTGLVLTKLDGDARGGAALSMRAVTGSPIKFVGVGEKLDALEVFHPDRLASRILGMGDMMTLIEKAVKEVNFEETAKLHKKMKKETFGFDDFLNQLKTVRKMGSIGGIMSMIPGMGKLSESLDSERAEREMKRVEAIILSMTPHERSNPSLIDGSRRKRIAKGSGTKVEDINRLLKQFLEMRKMMKKLTSGGLLGGLSKQGLGQITNLMKGVK